MCTPPCPPAFWAPKGLNGGPGGGHGHSLPLPCACFLLLSPREVLLLGDMVPCSSPLGQGHYGADLSRTRLPCHQKGHCCPPPKKCGAHPLPLPAHRPSEAAASHLPHAHLAPVRGQPGTWHTSLPPVGHTSLVPVTHRPVGTGPAKDLSASPDGSLEPSQNVHSNLNPEAKSTFYVVFFE